MSKVDDARANGIGGECLGCGETWQVGTATLEQMEDCHPDSDLVLY